MLKGEGGGAIIHVGPSPTTETLPIFWASTTFRGMQQAHLHIAIALGVLQSWTFSTLHGGRSGAASVGWYMGSARRGPERYSQHSPWPLGARRKRLFRSLRPLFFLALADPLRRIAGESQPRQHPKKQAPDVALEASFLPLIGVAVPTSDGCRMIEDLEEVGAGLTVGAHCCRSRSRPAARPPGPVGWAATKALRRVGLHLRPGGEALCGRLPNDSCLPTTSSPKARAAPPLHVAVVSDWAPVRWPLPNRRDRGGRVGGLIGVGNPGFMQLLPIGCRPLGGDSPAPGVTRTDTWVGAPEPSAEYCNTQLL
jgi:hypothetical protein